MAFNGKNGPDLPLVVAGYGLKTPFGILLPPGGRVAAYVRSTGIQSQDDDSIRNNLVTTLAAGLARCRSGLGDTVVCLPGHSESVTDATMLDNLVDGTRILGVGHGGNMPVFRWTATASQWVMNNADVVVSGLRLRLEGANGVVKAIAVTGADNVISGCDIEVASGAALKATIAVEAGAGAHRFEFSGNVMRGTATHNVTDGVLVAAAVTDARICSNEMVFSATAANGCIRVSAAALGLKIMGNRIFNTHTGSTAGIAFGNVACTGIAADNYVGILTDGTANATGLTFGAAALIRAFQNFVSDEANRSGALSPAAAAT